ncbi:EpsG family protein [Acinetobacter sp. YH12043]|uniref:EpsG family protein n=1 Tax=Acinetobacter sp. YH12043 TaxID=2601050 RepID=UPI0015D17731|nr:EpsG family protein [Acinetobacter sp. YH12043]
MKNNIFIVRRDFIPYWVVASLFALIVAFRGGTRDTDVYAYIFNTINNYSLGIKSFYDSTGVEVGYGYLAKIFFNLGFSFTIFSLFISFVTFLFIKKASDNFKANSFLVLLCYIPVFFANHQLMQIRQGLAVAAVFFSLSLLLANKSKLKGLFFFLFGAFFHNVVVLIYLFNLSLVRKILTIKKIKFSIKILLLVVAVFVVCRLFSSLGLIFLTDRISNYSNTSYSEERSILHPVNLRSVILLLIFVFFRPKNNKIFDYLTIIYSIGVGLRFGFYDFLILSGRVSTLFTYAEIFLIPLILKEKFNKFMVMILVFIYFLLSLYINLVIQVPFVLDDYFKPIF